ncbi:MAG TPA: 2'-5' RNA ligase family protein [Chloroflexota bacterium]
MPFAVVLNLDEAASRAIEDAQAAVIRAGLSSPDTQVMNFWPHISLAISEDLDVRGFEPYLRDLAAGTPPFELCFARLEVFEPEPKVLYLAPADSPDLTAMHQRLHSEYSSFAFRPWEYYSPGKWVPHCTVADGLRGENVAKARELFESLHLPIYVHLDEVALVGFYPTESYYSFKLGAA